MADKLIFISCGQRTDGEKALGALLKSAVDGTLGFQAYFADSVHDLDSLTHHVFDGLHRCAGAIVVLQNRGLVTETGGAAWGHRSSVWVNQEVAILAYRQFIESTKVSILAFIEAGVRLEGAMTSLIVNPQPLPPSAAIVSSVISWLATSDFAGVTRDAFLEKWAQLSNAARRVVAVVIEEGGQNVKESSVRQGLAKRFGLSSNKASQEVQESKLEFVNTDLVKLISNIHSGHELSINPTWERQLRRECTGWLTGT